MTNSPLIIGQDITGAGEAAEGALTGNPISLIGGIANLASGLFGSSGGGPQQTAAVSSGGGGTTVVAPTYTPGGSFFGIPTPGHTTPGLAIAAPAVNPQLPAAIQPTLPSIPTAQAMQMAPLSALPSPGGYSAGGGAPGTSGGYTPSAIQTTSQPQIVQQASPASTTPPLQGYVSNTPPPPGAFNQEPSDLDSPQAVGNRQAQAAAAEPALTPFQAQAQQMMTNASQFMQPVFKSFGDFLASPAYGQGRNAAAYTPNAPPNSPPAIQPGISNATVGQNYNAPGVPHGNPQLQAQQPQADYSQRTAGNPNLLGGTAMTPGLALLKDYMNAHTPQLVQTGINLGKQPIVNASLQSLKGLNDDLNNRMKILDQQTENMTKQALTPLLDDRGQIFDGKNFVGSNGKAMNLMEKRSDIQGQIFKLGELITSRLQHHRLTPAETKAMAEQVLQNGKNMKQEELLSAIDKLGRDERADTYKKAYRADAEKLAAVQGAFKATGPLGGIGGFLNGYNNTISKLQQAMEPDDTLMEARAQAQLKLDDYNQASLLEGERNNLERVTKGIDDLRHQYDVDLNDARKTLQDANAAAANALVNSFTAQVHALASTGNLTAAIYEAEAARSRADEASDQRAQQNDLGFLQLAEKSNVDYDKLFESADNQQIKLADMQAKSNQGMLETKAKLQESTQKEVAAVDGLKNSLNSDDRAARIKAIYAREDAQIKQAQEEAKMHQDVLQDEINRISETKNKIRLAQSQSGAKTTEAASNTSPIKKK